jgi:hypothetical protein
LHFTKSDNSGMLVCSNTVSDGEGSESFMGEVLFLQSREDLAIPVPRKRSLVGCPADRRPE